MSQPNQNEVLLPVTLDEAVVLFEFLQRYSNTEVLGIEDQAEQRALWNLCCVLEKRLTVPFETSYIEFLKDARNRLRDKS